MRVAPIPGNECQSGPIATHDDSHMSVFKQLFDPASGTLSYLLCDPVTRATALIDPPPDPTNALAKLLRQLGLSLCYVLKTHAHPDGNATLPELRATTGARLAAHDLDTVDGLRPAIT